ncbi:hypothetical protein BDF21DRAFT_451028 [Thamnidium elegans]|uniref:Mso1 N-terminal domain-containing protein n=1 Tax=Thamnidium elegans TaxID=101142 RepID=A0A8H7VWU9_9FUNG|nr:hypothetical protein INT48_007219 [Thamnidium elegans]KAI8085716.1 hypothetical protein BDF21DRAFT_451028 [Thamnidium elegans]
MGAQVVDYRVSTLVVLCKDCGHDVGLYPARHKCVPVERPAMPALPSKYQKSTPLPASLQLNSRAMSSGSTLSTTSSPSPGFSSVEQVNSKWSSRLGKSSAQDQEEDSVYFNNFASNLPDHHEQPASGKKLWGKVKQNEKWKQLSEKNDKPKQTGKLWGKLMQATQNMADKIPSRDDRGAESDEDDWEGETHVSRILREYYEKKRLPLPDWLFDDDMPAVSRKKSATRKQPQKMDLNVSENQGPVRTPSRRRLWEQNPADPKNISSRERERQELRQAQPPPPPVPSNVRNNANEDRYGNRENDRYREPERYRDSDHYRENDRYRDNQRDENHYRDDYRDQKNSTYNDYHAPPVDHYYQQPSRPQPKSTNRPRYYDEDVPPPRSERSTRGYQRDAAAPRAVQNPQSDRGQDLDDYYYSDRDHSRREPSARSGGRRYGNDPTYF